MCKSGKLFLLKRLCAQTRRCFYENTVVCASGLIVCRSTHPQQQLSSSVPQFIQDKANKKVTWTCACVSIVAGGLASAAIHARIVCTPILTRHLKKESELFKQLVSRLTSSQPRETFQLKIFYVFDNLVRQSHTNRHTLVG